MKTKKKTKPVETVTSVTYARLKNLGNYENERCEIEVKLRAGETPEQAFSRARALVDAALEGSRERAPAARGRHFSIDVADYDDHGFPWDSDDR